MTPNNIGNIIKKLRESSNMSQSEFGEKYQISPQAVSKWERGVSIPDITILKKMSEDYNISINDIIDGNIIKKKNKKTFYIFLLTFTILITTIIFIMSSNNNNFKIKYISTTCNDFNITGMMAYNEKKSSIYLSGITYCGDEDLTKYKEIDCKLYEKHDNNEVIISEVKKQGNITLEEFLKEVSFKIDNYNKMCKDYTKENLYLEINATDIKNKITTYKIPLILENKCN